MTAPVYRHKGSSSLHHAIQFIQDDPTTHWHVNFGHPAAETLKDTFWVRTLDGPAPVSDKDWILRAEGTNSDYARVVTPEHFERDYEFVRSAPLGKGDLRKLNA